jgi:hypothetical protein
MKGLVLALLALCFAASAQARDVRYPDSGFPAVTFTIPDDWAANPDSDGNIIVVSADRATAIAMTVATGGGSLDEVAFGSMKVAQAAPPRRGEPVSVSGFSGFAYYSTMTNDAKVNLNVKMIAVKPDAQHFVTFSLISLNEATPEQMEAANAVMTSVQIVTQ